MKMDFVDESALEAEEVPEGERGKIVLVGEPMGLFMAEEPGELEDVAHFAAAVAGAEYNVAVGLSRLGHTALYCTRLGDDPIGLEGIVDADLRGLLLGVGGELVELGILGGVLRLGHHCSSSIRVS